MPAAMFCLVALLEVDRRRARRTAVRKHGLRERRNQQAREGKTPHESSVSPQSSSLS